MAVLLFAPTVHAEKRVALVIGNAAYENTAALANPVNDAEAIATALQKVGFAVILERNLDKPGMENAVARFARISQDADAALFYYAGHGMQYRGSNYLVPVDAKLEDEFKLTFELTRLDDVLFGLEQARGVKILILDACRDNPLADRLTHTAASRGFSPMQGLAKVEAGRGMIIAYSTQPNRVAIDGDGPHSPFTAALIKEIAEPGVEIGTMFRRVAADVNSMTNGRQLPELSVSLIGDFYLNNHDTDLQAWTKLKGATDAGRLATFLRQYPNSPLASEVQERLAAVERELAEKARREQAEREQVEREQRAKEQAEKDRLAQQLAERQRLAAAQAERDREAEEAVREQAEKVRLAKEQAERERMASEQHAQQPQQQAQQVPKPAPPVNAEAAHPPPNPEVQTAMLSPPAQSVVAKPGEALTGPSLIRAIKKELERVGCYSGQIDENWADSDTTSSVSKFVRFAKLTSAPDNPSLDFLNTLKGKSGRVCPLECGAGRIDREGRCVIKTCRRSFVLNSEGDCEPAKTTSRSKQFDGSWTVTWTGVTNCRLKTGTYVLRIDNGVISGKHQHSGTVSASGAARWSGTSANGYHVSDVGSLKGNSGFGRFYNVMGCQGTFVARKD